uniref:Family with sequence similarity 83 member E n=1 Tax=Neogobius melanostomus TaxID=47308 RepID=A0A8C6SV24_9GOBI
GGEARCQKHCKKRILEEFLYSEPERLAVERLLNAGPEAFYSTVGAGQSSCFLSPDEVTEITNWAQDYHLSPHPKEENGEFGQGLDFGGYSSTYYPAHSDTPAPCLALGWPESSPWRREDSVRVYTSPPAEGEPSVRELIRRKLQTATQVCLIMLCIYGHIFNRHTYMPDQKKSCQTMTGGTVYIGKSFCSRAGRMVAGEMRSKFVLVDLQTVIHGSYSLTWSDAHLHRQLVTVLTGSVVDSFDHEFRILFAASSPVPEPRIGSCGQISNHLNNFSDTWFPKHLPFLDTEITNPPSPPSDGQLDWEAMGVISGGCSVPNSPVEPHNDVFLKDKPVLNNMMLEKNPKFVDNFFSNKHMVLDKKR